VQEQVQGFTGVGVVELRPRLIVVSVKVPENMLRALDELVELKKFKNRSHAIRAGIRLLLLKESKSWINS
jgi:metal-responsive CopG/Arc/MetJ family transcriptional regulator